MSSEIRANKQTNRVGLGTVTYTDTGIIVSGIVTATTFSGNLSGSVSAPSADIDDFISVGSNIHLGNAGVVTATSFIGNLTGNLTGNVVVSNETDNDTTCFPIFATNATGSLPLKSKSNLTFNSSTGALTATSFSGTTATIGDYLDVGSNIKLGNAGVVTATSFIGDGSALSNLPAGAPVGGASTNTVFFENDVAVAVNYQITSSKNAMSAGPIAINAGIAVTVPSGSSWTIV